jgi:DNA (cytosine-5)-methyltransferase 1
VGLKFIDLFAGIGGFRLGMEEAGHECVGWVEIDKFARKSYEAIHDTEGEWTASDIRSVTDDDLGLLRERGIDVICGGFPCQAFSVAGKRGGFSDTRGTLFFEIARFAKQIKPRLLFLENVKGLLSHDKGKTFATILNTLDELGYDAEWQVLNSKDFGVPQNRERVFIIGHLRGEPRREIFPIERQSNENSTVGKSTKTAVARTFTAGGNSGGNHSGMTILSVLTPDRVEKRQNGRRFKEPGEPMFTITSQDRHGVAIKEATKKGYDIAEPGDSINYSVPESKTRRGRVGKGVANTLDTGCQQGVLTEDCKIRRLTPRECWRLQGFPDWAFNKSTEVNKDSQLYKQAGNSVTVNVIEAIAKRFKG